MIEINFLTAIFFNDNTRLIILNQVLIMEILYAMENLQWSCRLDGAPIYDYNRKNFDVINVPSVSTISRQRLKKETVPAVVRTAARYPGPLATPLKELRKV